MIYRKQGSVTRWENGTLIRVDEEGFAHVDDGVFECEPAGTKPRDPSSFQSGDLHRVAAAVRAAAEDVTVERLVVAAGEAAHPYGERRWSETTRRMHIALTRGPLRVMIDVADFDVAPVEAVARSLRRLDLARTVVPSRLRVAPAVVAALLPFMAAMAPDGARVVQTAGGVDGFGEPIVEAERDWPNWFRPSYRIAPRRMPMNLRIEAAEEAIDPSLPCAVAALAPASGESVRVLLDDGVRSWPATIRFGNVLAVSSRRSWYPYAAGSFGAEMML